MQYGHFDDEAREYVIDTPDTPEPWINYLGSDGFYSLISHTQGGYCFFEDARLRRLTRFRYNDIPTGENGRYLFVRDGMDVWSPSFAPCRVPLDSFECRHGLGHTTVTGARGGVSVTTTTLVPQGTTAEISRAVVTNTSRQTKTISLFSYVEFCLWDALDDQTNYQRNLSLAEVEVDGSAIYHKTEYRERRNHYAVFWTNSPIVGFDTDRDAFIGKGRILGQAVVPQQGQSTRSVASGWYPIGSHQIEVTLAPGASRDIIFGLGYVENPSDDKWETPTPALISTNRPMPGPVTGIVNKAPARDLMARFATSAQFEAALAGLRRFWDAKLSGFVVHSGDARFDRAVNAWNPYQCMTTFNLSRSASFFETGIGRGMGFRDSNQDLLGIVAMEPDRSRQRIIDLASTQFADGSAYHQYQPLTKRGNHGLGAGFNDDPLWLIVGVACYIKETGDWTILDEPTPFDNDLAQAGPLIDHLMASFRHVVSNLGPHGLPLIGRADWNDCLNLNCFSTQPGESFQTTQGRGDGLVAESLFIAGLFCWAVPDLVVMLDRRGVSSGEVSTALAAMHNAIDVSGWDGEWFLRAYDAFGAPVGSSRNDEGKIFIESQGMCVMGGCGADDGRARQALDSVAQHLAGPHGIALLAPPYTRYHVELGEISSYPPGYKENGGVFCHNNPWVIIAEAIAGSPERALDYYQRITYREQVADVHGLEPYVYAQMVAGPGSARPGEAKNSWLTGTAAWSYYASACYLLGVRADFDGLIVDPKMPAGFGSFTVIKRFRGATYHIAVDNPGGPGELTVDGARLNGKVLPLAPVGATVEVRWVGQASG
ncbi:MAG: hypothetical protein FWF36_04390 [Propionibacteriaceae bacterium]|nr:hypothetical protein [Propionibacteriaceae bacterium]